MNAAADFVRAVPVSGKGLALLGSFTVHAALALAAARGAPHASVSAALASEPLVEIATLEVDEAAPPLDPARTAAAPAAPAHHHHEYAVPPDHDATEHDPALRHLLPRPSAPAPAAPTRVSEAPAVLEAPAPAAPRFALTVGPATSRPSGAQSAADRGEPSDEGQLVAAAPATEASVDTPARLLSGNSPSYTREAEAAGVEADVPLEIVVDSAGAVVSARVLAQVGYGLDQAALGSVRAFRFSPARRGGKALAVRMRWLMRFQLR